MEKSSCFWGLLGGKKDGNRGTIDWPDLKKEKKEKKKKWSFIRSPKEKNKTMTISSPQHATGGNNDARLSFAISYNSESIEDQSRHAIAVAAATAAVAEAAVAAAQAAAAVVRLTSGSGRRASTYGVNIFKREEWAAVKIQSYFRGYLARRALRALKGLVRLQALVRGYIVRKGMAESLRCLRALISAQSMAQAGWTLAPESRQILSHTNYGPTTPGRYEQLTRGNSTRHEKSSPFKNAQAQPSLHRPIYEQGSTSRPSSRDGNILDRMQLPRNLSEQQLEELLWEHRRGTPEKTMYTDDEKGDKILEIDTGKPHSNPKRRHNFFNSCKHVPTTPDRNIHSVNTVGSPSGDSTTALLPARSLASGDIQSLRRFEYSLEVDDISLCTADNSPHNYSATSRPDSAKTRSDYSQNFFSRYLDSRSLLNEYSDYPNYMSNTESFRAKVRSHSAPRQRSYRVEKCSSTRRFSLQGSVDTGSQKASSVLEVNFKSKAYPGSGRLDRLAMAIDSDSVSLNGA